MIAKISAGRNTAGLIRYLFGPGRANEHTNPHLVASFDGFAPDPGRSPGGDPAAVRKQLTADLDLHVKQAKRLGRAPERHVWHCSIRATKDDRHLTDAEWGEVACRVVAATGIAPDGDPDGCRWVAVRHAEDHIHIAATTVRADLRRARHWNDYLTADRELATIEIEYGLHRVVRGDRTAAKRPTRAETEKARRHGRDATARELLRTRVRRAAAAAGTETEFFAFLEASGLRVRPKTGPSGDVLGYSVALPGDRNKHGEPVWFSGSTLASNLSLPQIRRHLDHTAPEPAAVPSVDPWHVATAVIERIPDHLTRGDDSAAQGQLAALGATLDLLPQAAPPAGRAELERAAGAFARATTSRIAADHASARALRHSIRQIWNDPVQHRDGAGVAMLIDAAFTAVAFAMHWHRTRQHAQQEVAAAQTLQHLRAAYQQTAEPALTSLAHRAPETRTRDRYAHHLHQTAPAQMERILADPAWPALTTTLADAEARGHDVAIVLGQALHSRPLDDARHPAEVLTWRLHRLGHRHAPGPRAQAARVRSPHVPIPSARPRTPGASAPGSQPTRGARRR